VKPLLTELYYASGDTEEDGADTDLEQGVDNPGGPAPARRPRSRSRGSVKALKTLAKNCRIARKRRLTFLVPAEDYHDNDVDTWSVPNLCYEEEYCDTPPRSRSPVSDEACTVRQGSEAGKVQKKMGKKEMARLVRRAIHALVEVGYLDKLERTREKMRRRRVKQQQAQRRQERRERREHAAEG
jgi:hypothetical protein